MKVKLNKFEQILMKMSSFWSKDIKQASKTGEIEFEIYGSTLLQVIGLPILITMLPLKYLFHNNIFSLIGIAGGICVILGVFYHILMLIDASKNSKKNKIQKKEQESNNTINYLSQDKNELMFTKEALEKELNHDKEINS